MSRYRWVHNGNEKLYDVGINTDGTLHNPRAIPTTSSALPFRPRTNAGTSAAARRLRKLERPAGSGKQFTPMRLLSAFGRDAPLVPDSAAPSVGVTWSTR